MNRTGEVWIDQSKSVHGLTKQTKSRSRDQDKLILSNMRGIQYSYTLWKLGNSFMYSPTSKASFYQETNSINFHKGPKIVSSPKTNRSQGPRATSPDQVKPYKHQPQFTYWVSLLSPWDCTPQRAGDTDSAITQRPNTNPRSGLRTRTKGENKC